MQIRHRDFVLDLESTEINISSNFDSGNLQEALVAKNKLILIPALDPLNPNYSTKHSSKTFFHFKISASEPIKVPITIRRMNILGYFPNDENFQQLYHVCVARCQKGSWTQLLNYQKSKLEDMKRVNVEGSYQLQFKICIDVQEQVYLAYHYPYPYQKLTSFLQEIKDRVITLNAEQKSNIYFCNQLLTQSMERRSINLITLTSISQIQQEEESRVSKSIFPYFEIEGRPKTFAKPYIFFTCRVHSGQTSSSFALEGIIDFLLSDDKRAKQLLNCFVFLFVPVLNPDGVFHGTYRMDTVGHNLNRFYNCAQSHKQPSIFAVQSIINYYGSRLIFFMDLHSHPHPNKGSFIYGNCLNNLEDQTQSQLFAKLLQMESNIFGYHWCSFSSSQMSSRDVNELLTKDGSARVQVYKLLNLPFIYTMEMGYHGFLSKNQADTQINWSIISKKNTIFTIDDYKLHGKSIAITIYNIYSQSCLGNSKQNGQKILQLREDICKQLFQKEERFRLMDSFVFRKVKNINQIINNQYYLPFFKKYPFVEKALEKKTVEKGLGYHSIAERINNKGRRSLTRRKQISLQLPPASRTIDFDIKGKAPLKSLKFTMQRGNEFVSEQIIIQNRNKFAKQLNLNFNPFPETQKKRIYNVIGNSRSVIKKNITNQCVSSYKHIPQFSTNQRMNVVDQIFRTIQLDDFRDKKLNNFSPQKHNEIIFQGRQNEYLDNLWKFTNEEDRFILPKIPAKFQKLQKYEKLFDIETQIQKQYLHKYKLNQHKNISNIMPMNVKATLRSNALKMKNTIKPFQ